MLFDSRERSDQDAKGYGESNWEFLDRSSLPEAQRARDFLAGSYARYPETHRSDLIGRIRGGDDTEFHAAVFELVVFSGLAALGCSIEVHPQLPNSSRRPDFLARTPAGDEAYVEATLASEFDREARASARRTKVVLDAIEQLDSPDFMIGFSAEGDPRTPPSGRLLRHSIRQWLSRLDYESARTGLETNQPNCFDEYRWEGDGWDIKFDAIPRRRDRRGPGRRTIGAIVGNAHWGTSHEIIRAAVKAKGSRYGELSLPLLIAINVDALSVQRDDEIAALFGDGQHLERLDDRSAPPRFARARNGAWVGPTGPRYTRVSGAWIFRRQQVLAIRLQRPAACKRRGWHDAVASRANTA
jgi:hypothetical protein